MLSDSTIATPFLPMTPLYTSLCLPLRSFDFFPFHPVSCRHSKSTLLQSMGSAISLPFPVSVPMLMVPKLNSFSLHWTCFFSLPALDQVALAHFSYVSGNFMCIASGGRPSSIQILLINHDHVVSARVFSYCRMSFLPQTLLLCPGLRLASGSKLLLGGVLSSEYL